MSRNVFTYGSLMFPEIWKRVVLGNYRAVPATVHGYARFAITRASYPGMVEADGALVDGILYFDVAPPDLAALDAFEGEEYRRDTVQVILSSGETVAADTYIYLVPQHLSKSPWRPETFEMASFLQTYCGFGE